MLLHKQYRRPIIYDGISGSQDVWSTRLSRGGNALTAGQQAKPSRTHFRNKQPDFTPLTDLPTWTYPEDALLSTFDVSVTCFLPYLAVVRLH